MSPALDSHVPPASRGQGRCLLASSCDVRAAFLAHGHVGPIPAANATFSPNTQPFRGQQEQFALLGVFLLPQPS